MEAVKTVLSAFLGIRRRADHDRETVQIKPVHLALTAVALVVVFIFTLLTVVRFVVG